MKLSEVIKAIEDGSKSDFKNGLLKLKNCELLRSVELDSNYVGGLAITLDGWEEVKPPRQWSEKELMLFKLFPEWAKWIAKDKYDKWCIFESKPAISGGFFYPNKEDSKEGEAASLFDFLTITFEESPIYIGDLKGE